MTASCNASESRIGSLSHSEGRECHPRKTGCLALFFLTTLFFLCSGFASWSQNVNPSSSPVKEGELLILVRSGESVNARGLEEGVQPISTRSSHCHFYDPIGLRMERGCLVPDSDGSFDFPAGALVQAHFNSAGCSLNMCQFHIGWFEHQ